MNDIILEILSDVFEGDKYYVSNNSNDKFLYFNITIKRFKYNNNLPNKIKSRYSFDLNKCVFIFYDISDDCMIRDLKTLNNHPKLKVLQRQHKLKSL